MGISFDALVVQMRNEAIRLVKLMGDKRLTLAIAESVTAGLMAHKLASVRGASDVLKGSLVCYSEQVKMDLLNINNQSLKKYSAESQIVTNELVKQLRKVIRADVHASVTGLAAHGGSETKNKPVGTVFFSVLFKNKVHNSSKTFRGSPLEIRKKACDEMFRMIQRILLKN
jgi:PncC family amidohydrolase